MSARLTAQDRALRAITEAAWQSTVQDLATAGGWRWFHAPDNRPVRTATGRSYVQNVRGGWPDLFCVRRARVVVLELKREQGRYEPGQIEWLLALQECGLEVACVRPRDKQLVVDTLVYGQRLPAFAPGESPLP